jgi:hypothetical protein
MKAGADVEIDSLAPARSAFWDFCFAKFLSPFPKRLNLSRREETGDGGSYQTY